MRRTFSYDGYGINGPDQYRERLATFTEAGHALPGLGKLLEAAPEMAASLRDVEIILASKHTLDVDDFAILENVRATLALVGPTPWKGAA